MAPRSGGRTGRITALRAHGMLLSALLCLTAPSDALASGESAVPATGDTTASLSVIPAPVHVSAREGSLTISPGTAVAFASDERIAPIATYLVDLLGRTRGLQLRLMPGGLPLSEPGIVLEIRPRDSGARRVDAGNSHRGGPEPLVRRHRIDESYVIDVTPAGVLVSAPEPAGLFYGAVTLWQMMTASAESRPQVTLPAVRVEDAPRFAWRGLMLDVARHYMPPDFIKRLIDWMALHKLNTFHWHLTDDQGWRLQIERYPRLTEVGAWRVPAGPAAQADIDPATGRARRHGGYYTHEEVRDIVRYAAERFVTIVPEIEMPGHAQAAIAAYPELGTGDVPPGPSSDWGVHTYLFNVEERTFGFLENVLTEVMALFPGEYVHVGGDEAVKDRWKASPRVQARMRELGVPDETALQAYFIRRMERFLARHGRRLIGWDEILEGGLPPAATVMSWRGARGGLEAARLGHDVVMAPAPNLYLDYLQSDSPHEPPGRPTYVTLADVYAFDPVPDGLDARQARHILGAQVNVWTEHMRTAERIQHNIFPRLAALAEVTWSPRERRDIGDFAHRLVRQLDRYRVLGITYADSAFEARFAGILPIGTGRVRLQLRNQMGIGQIRYTLDGSEPTADSAVYTAPLELPLPVRVKAATFVEGRRVSVPRERVFDRAQLLRRTDEELVMCSGKLPLRLEDDAPVDGERALFNVDILDPCWIFPQADLSRATSIAAAVGQLPFNFQVGRDADAIPLREPRTPEGELEVRAGDCNGEVVAVLPLQPAVSHHGVTVLGPAPLARRADRQDLCLVFTRRSIDPIWAIDWVQIIE